VFDVGMERSSQQLEKELHLDFALPTFRASQLTIFEARFTHLLSDSLGVMVAIRDASAITLAAICRICSAFSLKYSIMGVKGVKLHHVAGVCAHTRGIKSYHGLCRSPVGVQLLLKEGLAHSPVVVGAF